MNILNVAKTLLKELDSQIKKKDLNLRTHFSSKMPKYMSDEKLLGMVVQNLLSNAIKYTPEKGKIELEIKARKKEFFIRVSDTGLGIPKHQQNKVFTKLFRADNVISLSNEGTGLGLYIVKSIVELLGGEIWFESKEHKGTSFYVSLPRSKLKPIKQ